MISRVLRGPCYLLFCCILTMFAQSTLGASKPSGSDRNIVAKKFDLLPLRFEPNQGQSSSDAKFFAWGRGFSASFKENEADLVLDHRTGTCDLLRVSLPNARQNASISAESRLPGTVNYFNGNEPKNWHAGLPTFGRLRYVGVYAGIDLTYYGSQGRLEFDFEVSPGADPKSIRIRFDGAERAALDAEGNLIVTARNGEISFQRPVIYQPNGGKGKDLVAGSFSVLGKSTIGFVIAGYDHTRPLIIDPILNYSTYIGPLAEATSIAVGQNGEAYVTGVANLSFPTTPGSYQPVAVPSSTHAGLFPQGAKPFIAKFNSTGTALLYSTFLSGSGVDFASGIALDANGDTFVAGTTSSTDFPITTGALQTTNNASTTTGFVAELNSTGTSLLYSTYLGGSTSTSVSGVVVDGLGNTYLTGNTQDTNFPTTQGAYRTVAITKTTLGWTSAFVAKLNPTGTTLVYATYLGGSQDDIASAIAVDSSGEAYVGGSTTSNDFPVTAGAIQGTREASNRQAGFVTKLNAAGSALVYSTYLGGNALDYLNSIALDSNGNAYATGSTNSSDFPTTAGAFQSKIGVSYFGYAQENAFLTELNSSGTALVYSTFLGGNLSLSAQDAGVGDEATSVAVDGQGLVYLTGVACTGDFPVTAGAFEPQNLDGEITGECTVFLTKMKPTPNTPLVYSTFFGGTGNGDGADYYYGEEGNGLAIDPSGNVYLAGFTVSIDFPITAGVFETGFTNPSEEAFVAQFNGSEMKALPVPTITLTSNSSSVLFGQPVTFTATVQPGSATGYVGFDFFQQELSDTEGSGVGFGPWTAIALDGSGVATFTTSSLDELQTQVNAFYLGDANNAPATGSMIQTVTYIPTVTTVTSNANNVPYGTPVVFTATVLDNTGKPAKGFVYFAMGNVAYAEPQLNSAGQATWTNGTGGPVTLPVGTDTIEVPFFPAIGYQKSSATIAETFTALGTTPDPTLSLPAGTYLSIQQVTMSDSNSAASIYYTTDGSTPVPGVSPAAPAGIQLPVNESETLNVVAVAPGYSPSNVVTAAYTINLLADFTLSLSQPTLTLSSGGSGTTLVSVNALNGFAQSVSLSCSGLPPGVTCAFAPAAVIGSGTSTSTLTITASPGARMNTRPAGPLIPLVALAVAFGFIRIRQHRISLLMMLACALSLVALTGCGGGGGTSSLVSNSGSTTTTISVIGTSASRSHSISLTLTLTR